MLNLLGDRVKPDIRLCTDFLEGGRGHVWDEGRERNYENLSLRRDQIWTNMVVAELFEYISLGLLQVPQFSQDLGFLAVDLYAWSRYSVHRAEPNLT